MRLFSHGMRPTFTAVLFLAAAVMVAPAAAWASGKLDQSQTVHTGGLEIGGGPVAQTFTAGLTGGLDRVDLFLKDAPPWSSPLPLTVEIRDTSGGAPGSTVLASATVPTASMPWPGPRMVEVDFASPVPVVKGTQYAIVARPTGFAGFVWYGDDRTADVYSRGACWTWYASSWHSVALEDMTFKTYVVVPQPVAVSSVAPNWGPAGGGTQLTITGKAFAPGDRVVIDQGHGPGTGAIPATAVSVNSSTQITATTSGPAKPGTWHLYVIAPDGTASQATSANAFTYGPVVTSVAPHSGPAAGGTQVTITGKGFVTGDQVMIDQGHGPATGAIPATFVSVNSSTQITATIGGSAKPGIWHLYVIAPDGTASQATSANAFTYTVT
jgi:hypothetical protein